MTLQIKVALKSIETVEVPATGLKVEMNLQCWNEGDDIKVDPPVIDEDVESFCSGADPSIVPEEQVSRIVLDITKRMQQIINLYKIENNLLVGELLDAAISNIQDNLKG